MDDKNVSLKIIIILLLLLIVAYLYFGFIKKDDNVIQANDNNDSYEVIDDEYSEEIIAEMVNDINGFEVVKFNKILNDKDVVITISYNTKLEEEIVDGEKEERYAVIYQIYLNNYLVKNASDKYYYDSGSEADAFAEEIKEKEITTIRGLDNKEYLVINLHNPDVFSGDGGRDIYIINEFARLLGKIKTNDNPIMHKLDGEGSSKYFDIEKYLYYYIDKDRIYYLDSDDKKNYDNKYNYTEYELTIKNNKINTSKNVILVGSDFEGAEGYGSAKLTIY